MIATDAPPLVDLRTNSPTTIGRRLRDGIECVLHCSGAADVYARIAGRRGAVILMYHSVPPADLAPWIDPRNAMSLEVFREQMRFVAARRHVVSLTDLAATLARGETPPRGTVVLTFDDGYRDNLDVVAPILAEFQLPATLYLATGYVGRCENQWVDRLYAAFRARARHRLDVEPGSWDLVGADVARTAYLALCSRLLEATWAEREALIGSVCEQLAPSVRPPRLTLTWDEVRTLRSRFPQFEIGGHTKDHVDLRRSDVAACRAEVAGCADDIERELGRRPTHFSFPYGRSSPESRCVVIDSGFKTAVASGQGVLITPKSDLHGLCRIEAPASGVLFRHRTSGAYGACAIGATK